MPQAVPFSAVAPVNAGVAHYIVNKRFSLTTTPLQAAINTPARVGLVFSNTGANPILLYPGRVGGGNGGLLLPASSAPFVLDLNTVPGLVGIDWFAASTTGDASLTVISTIPQV